MARDDCERRRIHDDLAKCREELRIFKEKLEVVLSRARQGEGRAGNGGVGGEGGPGDGGGRGIGGGVPQKFRLALNFSCTCSLPLSPPTTQGGFSRARGGKPSESARRGKTKRKRFRKVGLHGS